MRGYIAGMNLRFVARAAPPFADTSALWYRVSGTPSQGEVSVRIGRGVDGRYFCTGLALDGAEMAITTTDLRRLPLGAIVDELVEAAAKISPTEDVAWVHLNDVDLAAAGGFVLVDPTTKQAIDTSKRSPDVDRLRAFAAAYRAALKGPDRRRPMAVTAKAMHISLASAHRWRRLCQQEGLLESLPETKESK